MKKKTILVFLATFGLALALGAGVLMAHGAQAQGTDFQERSSLQAAVGTAFTYQGRLENGSGPVDGTCDFQFSLWDASGGGSQVSSIQTKTGVLVSAGYLTVTDLDFGTSVFAGDARFLQIAVRCPTGSGSYTPLSGRVALNAAPYAHSLRPGARVYGSSTGSGLGQALLNVHNSYAGAGYTAVYGVSGAVTSSYPNTGIGVRGDAADGVGVAGNSDSGTGVSGYSGSGIGVSGSSNSGHGVFGRSYGDGADAGVSGVGAHAATGVYGSSDSGYGVFGYSSSGTAIYSDGNAHVEGNLTWQAKTSYIAVPAAAFQPRTAGYSFYNEGYSLVNADGASDSYVAPVQLPHGATMTGLTFYWSDNSSSENGSCTLYRSDVAGTAGDTVALAYTSGDAGQGSSLVANIDHTVDNSQSMYHLDLYLPDSDVGAYSVVIEYTTTTPH